MKNEITKAMLAMVVMTGCASEGRHPGSGGGPGDDEPQPVVEGTYALESSLELPDGYLAERAPLFDQFLAMTDDPDDPATWLLDQVEDRLGWFEAAALATAREALGLDGIVNQLILEHSPELVADLIQLGSDTAELAHGLELSSRLIVRETAGGALVADHEVVGIALASDGQVAPVEGVPMPAAARGVVVTVDSGVLRIDRHLLAIEQGAILKYGLEHVALPRVAPGADSVSGWLADEIDCAGIGARIEDLVEVGSPEDYQDACAAAVERAVDEVLGDAFEMRAQLAIGGRADLADDDGDELVDALDNGTWQGTMTVDGAALAMPAASFEGARE
jgi:hypothetical protein